MTLVGTDAFTSFFFPELLPPFDSPWSMIGHFEVPHLTILAVYNGWPNLQACFSPHGGCDLPVDFLQYFFWHSLRMAGTH